MKFDNIEEWVVGGAVGFVWAYFLGWWTFAVTGLSALLWAMGGAEGYSKGWRRIGVPVLICCIISMVQTSWLPLVSILPFFGVLTLGYGNPSFDVQGNLVDAGSPLGRLAWKLVTGGTPFLPDDKFVERKLNCIVRGFIALLIGLSMASLGFITLLPYLVATALLTVLMPMIVNSVE